MPSASPKGFDDRARSRDRGPEDRPWGGRELGRGRRRRERLLAQLGTALGPSLDHGEVLRRVSRLVAESLAHLCVIEVCQGNGVPGRVEVAHRDPDRTAFAEELFRESPDPDRPLPVESLLGSLEAHQGSKLPEGTLEELVRPGKPSRLLRDLEIRSSMIVSLRARGRLIGSMLLASSDPGREYDEEDRSLAVEIARRTALAVEDASRHAEVRAGVRTRDEFLAMVFHELGKPLQAASIAVRALERSVPKDDEKGRYYLDALESSTDLLRRLMRGLLESRSTDAVPFPFEPVQPARLRVGPLVSSSLELLEPLASVKSIRLVNRVPTDGLPDVRADPDRVFQVLSNLVGNALEHTPAGGSVLVEGSSGMEGLQISVLDSGMGIPDEDLSLVFEPFWRGPRSPGKGIGLGLSIAREIVRVHGGRIWAERLVEGGAALHFTLPLADPVEEAAEPEKPEPGPSPP